MKLSQDILFFKLMMKYPVCFLNRNTACMEFGYPVIYEARAAISGHVVIISSDELEKLLQHHCGNETLYICVGTRPAGPLLSKPSVIVVERNVSSISVANDLYEIFHEFEEWDDALKTVLYESGSFQELVNCCDPIIIEPLAITDKEFQLVACSGMSDELGYNSSVEEDRRLSLDAFNSFISQVDYDRICKNRDTFVIYIDDGNVVSRNIFDNNEYVGRIAIKLSTGEDYLQLFNTAILEHFYQYADRLYNKYSSFDNREFSKSSLIGILQDSISIRSISEKQCEEIYKENRWDKKDQFQLIQFMANPHQEKPFYAKYLSSKVNKKWQESICFTYMDHLLLLTDISKFSDQVRLSFIQALSDFLRTNDLIAGVSRAFRGISRLRSAYDQTETAMLIGVNKDPSFSYYMFDNYVLDYMLQNAKGNYENEEICSSKLLTLLQHDREKGTEYHKTLLVYFECKYNAAEAAKQLFINRSTFHYRLDKIQELVNINFESGDELLYLTMSFKILKIE